MPDKKLPISEFAAKIKSKYPQYKNIGDTDLVTKITNTYPKYKDMVDLSGISKKKELSEPVSPVGGETGISVPPSGFEELKPAKRQPTEVIKEPKVVGEDTLLAKKMERAQRPAVATTEVKLPAAPKVVAEEKAVAKDEQGWLANTVSALDRGFYKNLIGNPIKGLATVVQYGTEAMTGGRVKEGPVSDALNKLGDWFNNAIDEIAPQDPEFKNSLADQFTQALGQVGSIVFTGGLGAGGRAAGIATQAVPSAGRLAPAVAAGKELVSEITSPAAISAGLTMGQAEFDRAKKAGASDDQAFEAFYKNAAVGSILEKIPVMQFLKRFNNATAGGVANYIKTKGVAGITGGLEEATTEVLQQVYANKTAKDIYNTNQDIFEGLTESGGVGFGVGFLLNAMGANAKLLRKQGKEAEAQIVDAQIKEFESRAEKGPEVPPAPSVAPEMAQYTMEAPRLAGEPEQISKPIELSIEPKVPAAPAKAPITTIEVEEAARQMQPITDRMVQIEREFENLGYKIDTDYDNEMIVSDIEGNEVGEIPESLVPLAAEYEKATRRLGEFDDRARERALSKSREVVEAEAVEVKPELPAAFAKSRVQDAIDKYDEGEISTINDLVDEIEAIADEEGNQVVLDAVEEYREEQRYNESLKGRGDMDAAEDAFLSKIRGVGEVAPEAAPEVPVAPVQELKEGQQIQFNLPANQGQKTGTKVTVPGYEDVDFVAVQDGFNYDIYELASGLKVTPTTSFLVDDAISQTAATLASKGVTSEKLLSKIYNSEKAIKSLKINESPAIEKFKEKRIAEEEKVPFIHTEEERQKLFEIAKEAKEKGLSSAENIITNAANIKSGNKMNEERARAIIATSEKNKKFRDLEEQQKPYPQEDIVKREDTEEDFKQQINNEYKSDKYDTIPQDIKQKGYDAHRKLIEITNKYGYYPKSIKELKADPVIALSIYLRATGAKKVETRTDRIKAAEKVVDDTVKSINEIYNREFPEKAVGEVAPEAAPQVPAATKTEYKREEFPEEQIRVDTPVTQKLVNYLADVLEIPRINIADGKYISWLKEQTFNFFNLPGGENLAGLEFALNAPKQVFDRITKFAELSGIEAAPEVPAAPAEEEASDRKFWDEYGKSDYSYGQYGGKSSDTLYIRDRKSGKVVKEIKIKNKDFEGAKKEVFKWIDSKSGTKILEAYEEVYGEPELPAAPEKTQDEVAKEQTKETDLLLGGQAEQRRKDGKYTKDGVEYVRNPKGQGIASEVTGEVRFTNEVSLPFKYKLVEAETLQPSHQDGIRNPLHFIPEAQPKNRNDVGSLQAEESFANNPRFSELGENTNAYSGAPVVNERGEVVQGNNRSAGLRKGYQRNNPQYKNDLAANAEQFGFTREQVEGMKSPILVREIEVNDQGAVELGNYDVKDLETGGKRRIDPIAVTRRMPFDVKGRIADLFTGEETLNQAIRANQKRIIELINPYLNQAQRNTITRDGVLTEAGIKDLEAVVQQFLFDNGDTKLPDLFEKLFATQKEGLRKSLPYIYSVGIEKSIIPEIQEAIIATNEYIESGAGTFDAWLAQRDMFNEGKTPKDKYTELELEIARILAEAKTQKEITKKFIDYADVVKGKEADMFEPARLGKSKEEGVQEIFKVKYNAKSISERGGKEVAPKEKPTPEPSPEKRAGDAARSLAERIRAGKITRKGLQVSTGLDAIWDAALEVVATSLEAGASIADAIQDGIRYIRSTDFYKNATNKKQIEDNFANQLNEEYNAIQEPTAGKVPIQPKARAGEKVEAGVPPTRPPKAPKEEGEAEGRKEERRFSKTLINSPELLKAVKKGVGATLEYTRQANAMSVAQAQEILDVLGEDKAYNAMKDEQTNGAVRTVLGQVLIKRYNELAKKATSKEDKDLYIDTTIDIAEYVTKKLATEAGQTIQAFSLWKALTPEAQLVAAVKEVKKSARANVNKVRKDIDSLGEKFNKANEEAIKEILKSEEVDRSVKKDAQEGVQKAKDRASKARQKRADLIKKYKGKGGITLTTGGLTKEGIEFVGEVAVTYIEEGLAEVQVIAEKILADIKTVTGSSPNDKVKQEVFEIAEKELSKSDLKIVKSVKDQRLKINEIAIKHFTEVEKIKKDLAQKFVDEADMSEDNAEALAKRFEDAFDRVVSRKKAEILAKNKKRFDRIQKAINEQAGKKAEKKTLQDEIIKYSNLGAFTADDMLDFLAKKFNLGQLTTEQAAKIEELAQKIQKAPEGSPKREATEDLLAYQASLNKGNWGEVAQGIWYANILSGYRTHEKNIVSTFFNSLADLGTEVIADPKGAPYLIAGYMQGVGKKGMLEAMRTLKTGRSPIHVRAVEIPDILERKKFVGGGYNPANWFKYVGRAMKAEDVLSFQGLKEARAWQLARREAEKYGFNTWTRSGWQKVNELLLNTTERFEMAKDQALEEGLVENSLDYKRRIYELMENSRPEAMTEDAYNFAAHGTYNYNSDGTLGAVTNAISKSVLDVKVGGVQPGRFVVPFTRIITNVVNNALDYSPVGLIRAAKGARGFKSFDEVSITKGAYKPLTPEQRRIVAIKAAVGISFAAIIQYMVSAGLIDMSGEGPEDEKKKAQLREQGWQPYSIKIGDTWYSYFYTPLILTLGWMGNLNDAAKYGGEDEETLLRRASIASLKFGGMIADMTWINSAATFLGALTEPRINEQQRRVENALSGMARGFVPFAQNITQLTQAYNSTFQIPAKQVNNSWEALYQDIPIARNSLNDKINALGEPVIKDVDIMWSKEKGSPVWSFLTNKKGWVATLNRKTVLVFDQKLRQDRPLTDNEFYELSKLRGRYIKEDIERIMKEGYPVKREGAIKIVLGEDMTPKELNNILSKRIEPLATKKAKAKIFGFEYSEKEDDELNAELTELEREYWGLNEN